MKIRKECLGLKIVKKSPFNAEVFTMVISDDAENFALYKVLQLDVFEKNIPPVASVFESVSVDMVIETSLEKLPKGKSKPKKDKDAIN